MVLAVLVEECMAVERASGSLHATKQAALGLLSSLSRLRRIAHDAGHPAASTATTWTLIGEWWGQELGGLISRMKALESVAAEVTAARRFVEVQIGNRTEASAVHWLLSMACQVPAALQGIDWQQPIGPERIWQHCERLEWILEFDTDQLRVELDKEFDAAMTARTQKADSPAQLPGLQKPAGANAAALLDVAVREYASSAGSVRLAALPSGLQLDRCEENDPVCGEVSEGRTPLPWGCLKALGGGIAGELRHYDLLAFSLVHRQGDELDRFLAFAAEAGAALVASPPAWAQNVRPGDAQTTWVAALLLFAPAAAGYIVERKGGCRLITQPWAASVAIMRELAAADRLNAAEETAPLPPARHSTDFRSVHWFGTDFTFTPAQAACVKVLWREWKKGTPEVGEDTILEDPEVEAEAKRLIDVFRDRKEASGRHSAWGTMIVSGSTKGSYRLNPPKSSRATQIPL